jgi:hypothetical protein
VAARSRCGSLAGGVAAVKHGRGVSARRRCCGAIRSRGSLHLHQPDLFNDC